MKCVLSEGGLSWSTFTTRIWFFREMRVEMAEGIEQSEATWAVCPSGARVTDTLEIR